MALILADDDDDFLGNDVDEQDRNALFNDDNQVDAPAVDLLNVMKGFISEHSKTLADMREALSPTLSEAWDPENDVISLVTKPLDNAEILGMINTDNQQLNKVTKVFSVLCAEMAELRILAEEKFYGPLTMFGHKLSDADLKLLSEDERKMQSPEMQMGRFLSFLQDVSNFVKRCVSVSRNTINQLACLYHERQKLYISTFKHVHLDCVFEALGEICRTLITIDAIIEDNTAIGFAWSSYKRMIKYVRADPDRYGVDVTLLRQFEGCLLQLDRTILKAKVFETFLSQDFGLPGGQSSKALVSGNRVLSEEFSAVIKLLFRRYITGIGESVETYGRQVLVDLYGMYALYRRLFRSTTKPDKKLYKSLWQLQKDVPVVLLFGRAIWFIADFLVKYAPLNMKSLTPLPQHVVKTRKDYLAKLDDAFVKKTEDLYVHMCIWMVRIESELLTSKSHNVSAILNARSKLILNGMLLANQVRNLVTVSIHLHLLLEMPFRAKNVRCLAICSEMLKAIELTYRRRVSMTAENVAHMLGQTTYTLKRIFHPIKKKLDKRAKLDDTKLDVLAALNLSISLLAQVPTRERQVVLNIALSVAQLKNMLKQNHTDEVRYQLWKLRLLANWQQEVDRICNCDYLYWVSNLVPAFFQDIFKHPDQVDRLQYLFAAFKDSHRLLGSAYDNGAAYVKGYEREVTAHFEEQILTPLSRDVETDLRLHIHSVVLKQDELHRKSKGAVKDLSKFLNLHPLVFFDHYMDVPARVSHYLDAIFYNLNTVALHDWRVYAEMRNLAYEKYGLQMTDVHLPGSSHYSEALDILEIMRNIHIFVGNYNYNMNTQQFVQRAFDQKHLNIINIYHIADSIRTHGTGIMNTTVNFTYQFLVRKFQIFSEFLFDDHIKSRLMKDIRYFKQEKANLNNKYPYERAEKFNRDIRKLGVTDQGLTFLDQFRRQITEIGNALGYVRMVRSGGLHHCSNAIKFVPDLEDIPTFHENVDQQNLSPETSQAAANLDTILEELSDSFAEGTDYLAILVKVFSSVFGSERHAHLKNFYVIVAPLMLNFVESLSLRKDRISKKSGRSEAAFSDDGFALGVAYILKLLKQDEDFDSLHWFDAVSEYTAKKKHAIVEQKSGKGKKREEDTTHFQLTSKRLDNIQREIELLFFSFTGARIFFNDNAEDGNTEGEEKNDDGAAPAAAEPSPAAAEGVPPPPAPPAGGSVPPPPPPPPSAPPMAPPMAPPL